MQDDVNEISNSRGKNITSPPPVVWIIFFLMLTFTAYVSSIVYQEADSSAQIEFQRNTSKITEAITTRLNANEQILRGGIALFNTNGNVSRRQWHDYIESLNIRDHYPGIQGIGYAKVVKHEELQKFIHQIRAEGFSDFNIRPAGSRDEYTSIIYLEPFDFRNRRAFGYDMFSEATRHKAMVQARDSGFATISGKVKLVQETATDVQAGFLMYLPLYDRKKPISTVEERRSALLGYVYSPFRMNNLMQGVIGENFENSDIDIEIYDGETASADSLMYDFDNSLTGIKNTYHRKFISTRQLNINQHLWTVVLSSTPQFEKTVDQSKTLYVVLAGISLSLLFFITGWFMTNNRRQTQQLLERMNMALTEQKGLINAIVDDAADGIITIDDHGRILSINHAATHIFGYLAQEIVGQNINILMPEPYHSEHDGYIRHFLQTGEGKIIGTGREVIGKRKSGEEFPMDLAVSEVMTGFPHRVFSGIVRDISERKKAEAALRHSEERFDLAIRGANDGLWDWDWVSKTSYHSPRWNEMLGFPAIETTVPEGDWLQSVHPADKKRAQIDLQSYLDGKTPNFTTEVRMQHASGHYVWVLIRGIAERDSSGKITRMVGINSDISRQKHMDNLKSEFVSVVSHELRTPLTSIKGALGLVTGGATGELGPQTKQMLDIAYKNSDRLLALINDLLDIDKIQTGKMEFHYKIQPLMPLIEQVIASNASYAEKYKVTFRQTGSLPDVKVNIDGDRLIQVLANLLSNAAKFSHENGSVEVDVSRYAERIRISVIDHGTGIPEQFHDRIFDKFTQADSTDTRHKGGTGLGLSISKAIIDTMHGYIGFNSQTNIGTTFYVDLDEWSDK